MIDGVKVLEVTQTKFLGVIINNKLTWNDHIKMIKIKISKNIGIISRMRFFVPRSVLLSLYHALVEPYLQYCNLVWATHRSSVLNELYLCQKRILRIITNSDRRCHSTPLFKQLNILPIFNINDLQVGCFMYSAVHKLMQTESLDSVFVRNSAFHSYDTRRCNDMHQVQYRLNVTKFSIRIRGPNLWNSLPSELQCSQTLRTFKKRYMQILIADL